MKLFILRHGKSVEIAENQYDVDRGLSKKGIKQIEKMGKYLHQSGIKSILSSSAKRTVLTTLGINKYLKLDNIVYEDELYLADAHTIHNHITKLDWREDMLFVGHNFGISQLVTFYTGEPTLLSTGMLAVVEFDFESSAFFSQDTGTLIETVKPKLL